MPLLSSVTRFDPVLYKDNVSIVRKRYPKIEIWIHSQRNTISENDIAFDGQERTNLAAVADGVHYGTNMSKKFLFQSLSTIWFYV